MSYNYFVFYKLYQKLNPESLTFSNFFKMLYNENEVIDMILIPRPKKFEIKDDVFEFKSGEYIFLSTKNLFKSAEKVKRVLKDFGVELFISYYKGSKTSIYVEVERGKIKEKSGYKLIVSSDGVKVYGNNNLGVHYGLMTLVQIIRNYGNTIPFMEIHDWPDIENRGVLIDISRDKVPKLETLYYIVDLLSELKYNQFQLYTEHTFAYREHEKVWRDYSPFTSEDIIKLDKYCKERFIELVPNQASFGHMEKWLSHNEYSYLAETFEFNTSCGEHYSHPFTLSPAVSDSIEFLDSLYRELLPHFSSKHFNVNADETFDLCQGKSKPLCEKHGKGKVYLSFVLKIYNLVKKYGKKMMVWADILKNYPELFNDLPKDVVYLIWGYEKDHNFDAECELFRGFEFYVCPGTSSWNSFLGRLENALLNIKNATESGLKYGAKGILVTDWGDNGHWQHLPISFPGFFYTSAVSWGFDKNQDIDLKEALSLYFGEQVSEILLEVGNAYKLLEFEVPNSSIFALVFIKPEFINKKFISKLKIEALVKTKDYLEERLSKINILNDNLIKYELKNAIEFSILAIEILLSARKSKLDSLEGISPVAREEFSIRLEKLINEFEKIWLKRNKMGGLSYSIEKLRKIQNIFKELKK
ncbi:beta-N-acetylhexosaminidase [Thermosipho melanesiensis]|uniref:beta-N-acetylhexosaminidase n=3 Tax=Thermosipho melanesiensis TaxID=46541 RepID=A6LMC8_THEM4|nr:family 20 glycosylhydrolase [Thermosipho melanesiensis]ABR31079.1 glycoside hydrolase, family 20 [Thermosipho melanesiensis BI429]